MRRSFVFLPFAITFDSPAANEDFESSLRRSNLITNSKFSQRYWADRLDVPISSISVVYPFAHPAFGEVARRRDETICRVLYPNRITAEKGIYVFLEAIAYLHEQSRFSFRILGSGNKTEQGKISEALLRNLPNIEFVDAVVSREDMAAQYAASDIVVVPSRNDIWQEPFGMTSVEAQHAGCRVIASKSGGLPETDCGMLALIEAGDAVKLKQNIEAVAAMKPPSSEEREAAKNRFTLAQSVDSFLKVLNLPG